MSPARVMVLGVGNLLMQDDGIGVRVVRELAAGYELSPRLRLIDAGVASFAWLDELAHAELLLIVDAVRGTMPPGTISWLAPEDLAGTAGPLLSGHDVVLADVLGMARLLGTLPLTRILGVQTPAAEQPGLELSPALSRALPNVVAALADELNRLGLAVKKKQPPWG